MTWTTGWRERAWSQLDRAWDVIVIGGGITGAGILREAARAGLRVLLVEAGDFASGTSSRSSKLVHGGLRYLKNLEFGLTVESVRERERLMRGGRGLINPLGCILASYAGDGTPPWQFGVGLALYDLVALHWSHAFCGASGLRRRVRQFKPTGLIGAQRYFEAQTDDARLVLRLIREAVDPGSGAEALALNYARAESLLRNASGEVQGVVVRDLAPGAGGRAREVRARVVFNATGAWADELRAQLGRNERLRRLRGSHLVFPAERLPLRRAVSFLHPADRRPVFAVPWEGVMLLGTTDVDHAASLSEEPTIQPAEIEYLLAAAAFGFPDSALTLDDAQAAYSGVRPVVNTGKANPSKESREMVLWNENGLLTVAGGKLTTFRATAVQALQAARGRLPARARSAAGQGRRGAILDAAPAALLAATSLDPALRVHLLGRYGTQAPALLAAAHTGECESIAGSQALWAELRWAARAEGVVHLDDLLLRRVRLGLLLPGGGLEQLDRLRAIVQPELGWDDARWSVEVKRYAVRWRERYRPWDA